MIRQAREEDKQFIYQIWKELFAMDDNGYTDYYFKNMYKTENTWVSEVDHQIVATLQMNPHTIMLRDKKINASMILGVATIPSQQKKGHMHALMNEVLSIAEQREMVTLIQAYEPSIYRQFGFSMIYHRMKTTYPSSHLAKYQALKPADSYQIGELKYLYQQFTSKFEGYYLRDEQYFRNYVKEIASEGGKIAVYRNDNRQPEGYMIYYIVDDAVEIREIIYLHSWAFLGLLSYASKFGKEVSVFTSDAETVNKMIAGGTTKDLPFTMARVNDYSLFNICFDSAVQSVDEAFAIGLKPLWLHEYA